VTAAGAVCMYVLVSGVGFLSEAFFFLDSADAYSIHGTWREPWRMCEGLVVCGSVRDAVDFRIGRA